MADDSDADSKSEIQFAAVTEKDGIRVGAVLEIVPADDKSDKYLAKVWDKLSQALRNHHDLADDAATCPAWTKWKPHEWAKQNCPARQRFAAWHDGVMAGFVNLQPGFDSPHEVNRKVMYLEHMAAFPGNQPSQIWKRRLLHVGIPLLAFAVCQSRDQGFHGALGLHVADGADGFYANLSGLLGFQVFRDAMYDISGPPPELHRSKPQKYLEISPEAAIQILEAQRHA